MVDKEYDPNSIPVLEGVGKQMDVDPGLGVTVLYVEEMKAAVGKELAAIMKNNEDLWFIQARDKHGKEILFFRGSHP